MIFDVFATKLHEMPGLKDCQYDIQLKNGAKPVRPRQYRYPPAQQKIIQEQLDQWEQAGIIKEGTPTWTSTSSLDNQLVNSDLLLSFYSASRLPELTFPIELSAAQLLLFGILYLWTLWIAHLSLFLKLD